MATIEEMFERGADLNMDPVPLEHGVARQPDDVKGVGELTDVSDPPAQARLADSETTLVFTPAVDAPEPTDVRLVVMVPVLVTELGGFVGDHNTKAQFIYDVTDLVGNVLGTSGMGPTRIRPVGRLIAPPAGSVGVGYWDGTGTFFLWDANEVLDTGPC